MATTVTGSIGNNSIVGYINSLKRNGNICNPGQHAEITLASNWPYALSTAMDVVLYEQGHKVMTGYVVKITTERPDGKIVVYADDTYTRLSHYFLPDVDLTTEGHNTDYYIDFLMNEAGCAYNIAGGQARAVPAGVQLGMRSAHDSLQDILAYSSQYAYANPDGLIEIRQKSSGLVDHVITSGSITAIQESYGDESTRNVVKVYGLSDTGTINHSRIFSSQSIALDNIVPDRVTAVGSGLIATQAEADRVASYLLSELGTPTKIVTGTIIGKPTLRVGQLVQVKYSRHGTNIQTRDVLTSLESSWDDSGYTMNFTVGERCPRISGFAEVFPPVFAGTTKDGVFVSDDNGASWRTFNTGLPAGNKYVTRIAANALGEVMAIVNGAVYYATYASDITVPWKAVTPPYAGTKVVVTASGAPGGFYALIRSSIAGVTSTLVAQTTNKGATWTSTTVTDATGGTSYTGIDMSSSFGFPYILCTNSIPPPMPACCTLLEGLYSSIRIDQNLITGNFTCEDPNGYGITGMGPARVYQPTCIQTGIYPNRVVWFTISAQYYSLPGIYGYIHLYGVLTRGAATPTISTGYFDFTRAGWEGSQYPTTGPDGMWWFLGQGGGWITHTDLGLYSVLFTTVHFSESDVGSSFSFQFFTAMHAYPNSRLSSALLSGSDECDLVKYLAYQRKAELGAVGYTFS